MLGDLLGLLGGLSNPPTGQPTAPISLSIPRDHPMAQEILNAAQALATTRETASKVVYRTGKLDPDKCVEDFLVVLRKLAKYEGLDLDAEIDKLRSVQPGVGNGLLDIAKKLAKSEGLDIPGILG